LIGLGQLAVPLCENLPSGHATKPGDVIIAMNGKSIEVWIHYV
jgi:aminopeptidase